MNISIATFDCFACPEVDKILTNASENRFISYTYLNEMIEAFMAGVMIFIEQFQARWSWSIGMLES